MKTKKCSCKVFILFLFLLVPGFNSCEAFYEIFYCEECTNGKETFWECSQNAISEWESMGYSCE